MKTTQSKEVSVNDLHKVIIIDQILPMVAGIQPYELRTKPSDKYTNTVRHMCIYLIYMSTKFTKKQIAKIYDRTSSSATNKAIKKVENELYDTPLFEHLQTEFNKRLEEFKASPTKRSAYLLSVFHKIKTLFNKLFKLWKN